MRRKYRRLLKIASLICALAISLHGINWLAKAAVDREYNAIINGSKKVEYVSNTNSAKQDNLTAPQHDSCRPKNSGEATIAATATDSRGYSYALWLYEPKSTNTERGTDHEDTRTRVTSLFGEACGIAYDSSYGSVITERVPLSVARSLTKQLFQSLAETSGGIEQFKTEIMQNLEHSREVRESGRRSMSAEMPDYTSVEIWALNEIGITIPDGYYELIDIDDRWAYDYEVP